MSEAEEQNDETEQLEDQNGEVLPDREAMSVISPDGLFVPPGDEWVPPPSEKEGI